MTKAVRIENADCSDHHIVAETWQNGSDGHPDVLVAATPLCGPTAMTTLYVWQGQYIVIKELVQANEQKQ